MSVAYRSRTGDIGLSAGILALFVALSTGAFAQSAQQKWLPFVDFEAKPGSKRSLGEADIFQPLAQNSDTLLFANVRGRFDNQDSREGNAGLGLRHMLSSGWNVGVYGYYDRRRTQYDNYFNQATFGGELLGRDWDFRGNIYLPFGERVKDVDSLNTAEISGASVIFHGGEERALRGPTAAITIAVQVNGSSATVTGNTLSASGGATNDHTLLVNANILSGSSGNTVSAGNCNVTAGTGTTVTYTNAPACGP